MREETLQVVDRRLYRTLASSLCQAAASENMAYVEEWSLVSAEGHQLTDECDEGVFEG